jgi:hypothetical protein
MKKLKIFSIYKFFIIFTILFVNINSSIAEQIGNNQKISIREKRQLTASFGLFYYSGYTMGTDIIFNYNFNKIFSVGFLVGESSSPFYNSYGVHVRYYPSFIEFSDIFSIYFEPSFKYAFADSSSLFGGGNSRFYEVSSKVCIELRNNNGFTSNFGIGISKNNFINNNFINYSPSLSLNFGYSFSGLNKENFNNSTMDKNLILNTGVGYPEGLNLSVLYNQNKFGIGIGTGTDLREQVYYLKGRYNISQLEKGFKNYIELNNLFHISGYGYTYTISSIIGAESIFDNGIILNYGFGLHSDSYLRGLLPSYCFNLGYNFKIE